MVILTLISLLPLLQWSSWWERTKLKMGAGGHWRKMIYAALVADAIVVVVATSSLPCIIHILLESSVDLFYLESGRGKHLRGQVVWERRCCCSGVEKMNVIWMVVVVLLMVVEICLGFGSFVGKKKIHGLPGVQKLQASFLPFPEEWTDFSWWGNALVSGLGICCGWWTCSFQLDGFLVVQIYDCHCYVGENSGHCS